MSSPQDILQSVTSRAPPDAQYDPADENLQNIAFEAADQLVALGAGAAAEEIALKAKSETPLLTHITAKLAKSKELLNACPDNTHVSVVFAVYGEQNRILPRSQHPNGENILHMKIAQLTWLFSQKTSGSWALWITDDGCPHGSGGLLQKQIDENFPQLKDRLHVIFLQDAIDQKLPVAEGIATTKDSRKGGSIHFGMWSAAQHVPNQDSSVVIYTDCDVSTNLGLSGLLAYPLLLNGRFAAVGSRREPSAVVVKTGTRNTRGKLFIYLWKQMFKPYLEQVVDSQCGFKGFRANIVKELTEGCRERQFAFDVELLLKVMVQFGQDAVVNAGVFWVDSDALSTTSGGAAENADPYLDMLKKMRNTYISVLGEQGNNQYARFINEMEFEQWSYLVEHMPTEISEPDPGQLFGRIKGSPEEEERLMGILRQIIDRQNNKQDFKALINNFHQQNSNEDLETANSILIKFLTNLIKDPQNEKFRQFNTQNKTIQAKVLNCSGVLEMLQSLDFEEQGEFYLWVGNNPQKLQEGLNLLMNFQVNNFDTQLSTRESPHQQSGAHVEQPQKQQPQTNAQQSHQQAPQVLHEPKQQPQPAQSKESDEPVDLIDQLKAKQIGHAARKYEGLDAIWSGEAYKGPIKDGWYQGHGLYKFRNGVIYDGEFHKGEFHGKGTLIYPHGGRYKATWERGRAIEGEYEYYDGLMYDSEDWNYCQPQDRRFYTEIKEGMRPSGATLLVNNPAGPPKIPPGTYDIGVGLGYYDPETKKAFTYQGVEIPHVDHFDPNQVLNKYRYEPTPVEDISDDETIIPGQVKWKIFIRTRRLPQCKAPRWWQ